MKKISFVLPRMPWQYDPYSDPPIGLLSVAARVREIGGLEVELLDLAHDTLEKQLLIFISCDPTGSSHHQKSSVRKVFYLSCIT